MKALHCCATHLIGSTCIGIRVEMWPQQSSHYTSECTELVDPIFIPRRRRNCTQALSIIERHAMSATAIAGSLPEFSCSLFPLPLKNFLASPTVIFRWGKYIIGETV